jgi:hypothetical protein
MSTALTPTLCYLCTMSPALSAFKGTHPCLVITLLRLAHVRCLPTRFAHFLAVSPPHFPSCLDIARSPSLKTGPPHPCSVKGDCDNALQLEV